VRLNVRIKTAGLLLATGISAMLLLATCKQPVPAGPFLVAAGYIAPSTDVAAQWKDDLANTDPAVLTKLSETYEARSAAVYVAGSDVYVAGYIVDGIRKAGYWKNGTWELLHGTSAAEATDIVVSGSDVYVAGYYTNASAKTVACYWKNNSAGLVDLYDDTNNHGRANGITVDGSDVYVAGYYDDGYTKACFWNDSLAKVDLYTADYSEGYAIAVSGTDVYVAGYYRELYGMILTLKAGYWKNSSGGLVPLHEATAAKAFDLAVSGTDVYVAGYYKNASTVEAACYWKNNAAGQVDLFSDTVNEGRAYGICLDGTDVYVAGYVNEGTQTACYWRNGARTPLETGTSDCFSLAIQD
jgi:hypothetical protein